MDALTEYTLTASKYALIILSLLIIVRCIRSMLSDQYEGEVWGYLWHQSQTFTLTHWENLIGRSPGSAVRLAFPTPCSRGTTRASGAYTTYSPKAASGSTV